MKIYSPSITGSTGILGSLTVTGGVTASLEGTASFAITASHALNAGGQPGLVSGSGTNSMRNANFLVTTPATASGISSIVLGNNARSFADYSVMIGDSTQNYDSARPNSVAIGRNASTAQNTIAIGWGATGLSDSSVILGRDATANANNSVAIGWNAVASDGGAATTGSVSIGYNTRTQHFNEVNINNRFYFNSGSSGRVELRANTFVSGSITGSALQITGNSVFSGSVRGEVNALSITSNTASLNCALDNFFTLTLVSGSDTFINPTNIASGQTINLRITQANPGNGTVSFPSSVKQVSGSAYVPSTGAGPIDIVTLISFDNSSLYLSNVKNLV